MKVFQREKKFEIGALAEAIILMFGCGRAPIGDPSVDTDQIETLRKEAASLKSKLASTQSHIDNLRLELNNGNGDQTNFRQPR